MIEDIIQEFIAAQRYVVRFLTEHCDLPADTPSLDWTLFKRSLLNIHKKDPISQIFRPHGYGLEFKDSNVHVDFDFCPSGRPNGFDAWRLYWFSEQNLIDTPLNDEADFQKEIARLQKKGTVEKEENLYFLRGAQQPDGAYKS